MPVSFKQVPSATRVPRTMVEIDGSRALSSQGNEPHKVLMIGLRQSTGSAIEGQIKRIVGTLDGDGFFGVHSQLGQACRAFKRLNSTADLYAMALDEAGGGTAATCTFPITGTSATADGTLRVRINDVRVSIPVITGTTPTQAATALSSAIGLVERIMWTATPSTGTVALTCRHKGEAGNSPIALEVESIPAGLSCTPTQPSNGATNPTMSTAVAAMDDVAYDTFVTLLTDDTSMDALEAEAARRWGPTVMSPVGLIGAVCLSHGNTTTYGNGRNSAHSCVAGPGLSPTLPAIWAAQVAARDAQRSDTQPNRPRNGLSLPDCEAPKTGDRFDANERNLLLFDGISTCKVNSAGNVLVERLISTYQTNVNGSPDATYLDWGTTRNLQYLYKSALALGNKYADFLVAPDGTNVDPGVPVVTPKSYKGELLNWYALQERKGLVKDAEGFAADLVVEINADDPGRLDVHMVPRLVNGLVTIAKKISFIL